LSFVNPQLQDPGRKLDPALPEDFSSNYEGFENKDFSSYVKTIDGFPNESFDLVVVDGRARPSCAMHAIEKVKSGKYILFDNAERKHYGPIQDLLTRSGWKRRAFYGPHSYVVEFSCTAFWQKPSN